MQIVIDIDDLTYKYIENGKDISPEQYDRIELAIVDGTPLPEGHKVIDATKLQEHLAHVPIEDRTFREAEGIIDWFPSLIEADAESEE